MAEGWLDCGGLSCRDLAVHEDVGLLAGQRIAPLRARAVQSDLQVVLSLLNPARRLMGAELEQAPAASGTNRVNGVGTGVSGRLDRGYTVASERFDAAGVCAKHRRPRWVLTSWSLAIRASRSTCSSARLCTRASKPPPSRPSAPPNRNGAFRAHGARRPHGPPALSVKRAASPCSRAPDEE